MQKTYVNDKRKQVKNRGGQVNSWYAENDHVPIVSKRLWQKAQDALRDRRHYWVGQMDIKEITPENYPSLWADLLRILRTAALSENIQQRPHA